MARRNALRVDPTVKRIIVWHAVATCLVLAGAALLPNGFWGGRTVWWALHSAQLDALILYAAFGAAPGRSRLIVLVVGFACAVAVQSAWFWIHYGMMNPSDPEASPSAQLLGAVARQSLWYLPRYAAIACMRPFLGVIRKASPLRRRFASKITLRRVFLWTAIAALILTSVRVISDSRGYEGYLIGVLASCVLGGLTTVGLIAWAFAARRRWIGFLVWFFATVLLLSIWGGHFALKGQWSVETLLDWLGGSVFGMAATYVTFRPLRRAGYRLTEP